MLLNGSAMSFVCHATLCGQILHSFYMAYTGSAASAFGGRTTVKASGMFTTTVSEVQCMEWSGVRILVVDEISFMTENELKKLDVRLRHYRNIITQYLEGIALCLVGISDNSSEAMTMNTCIPGIQTSSSKVS
jgi:hypothetical protein